MQKYFIFQQALSQLCFRTSMSTVILVLTTSALISCKKASVPVLQNPYCWRCFLEDLDSATTLEVDTCTETNEAPVFYDSQMNSFLSYCSKR
jgi:hypothetical protein